MIDVMMLGIFQELTSIPPSVPAPDRAMVQLVPSQPPPSAERRSPARPTPAAAAPTSAAPAAPVAVVRPLLDTASTPDLSSHSATPPPRLTPPGSSPDLCHLSKITAGPRAPRRQSLPPSSCTVSPSGPPPAAPAAAASASAAAAASTAAYRRPLVRSCGRSVSQPTVQPSVLRQTRSVSVQREECGHPATVTVATAPGAGAGAGAAGGALRYRRQQVRQPPTPHTVTLDLPTPLGFGCTAQARRSSYKPRGLTKIQLASSVPENLTIIVGRKLEISLSGAKKGRQRGRAFR